MGRKIAPVVFILAILFFLLPWIKISVGGIDVLSASGFDMVRGVYNIPGSESLGIDFVAEGESEPLAVRALIAAGVGLVACLFTGTFGVLVRIAAGIAGIAFMIVLKSNIDTDINTMGMVPVDYQIGFWLTIVAFGIGIIAGAYKEEKAEEKTKSTSTKPKAVRSRTSRPKKKSPAAAAPVKPAKPTAKPKTATARKKSEIPRVKVGDINMYYEVHGKGEPLVFIVGLGASTTQSFLDIPAFSDDYKIVLFDNRGAGRSDAPPSPYSMEMLANDTAGLLDAIGIGDAHIMGRSMGGMIAQHFALQYPERVKSLVLMATDCGGPHYTSDREYDRYFADTKRMQALTIEERYKEQMPWLVSQEFIDNNPEIVKESIEKSMEYPTSPQGFAGQMKAIEGHDTYERLAEIKAPTLIIHGEADRVNPVENARILASRIPGAELVILKNMRHLFMLEAKEETNRVILDFLKKHSKPEQKT